MFALLRFKNPKVGLPTLTSGRGTWSMKNSNLKYFSLSSRLQSNVYNLSNGISNTNHNLFWHPKNLKPALFSRTNDLLFKYNLHQGVAFFHTSRVSSVSELSPRRRVPDISEFSPNSKRIPSLFAFFCVVWAACAFYAIHYGKQNSNVTQIVMYRVQHSNEALILLGDNIQFRYPFPWIKGKLHKRYGIIDISFEVTGSQNLGVVHYKSQRFGPIPHWVELECSLTSNGKTIPLGSLDHDNQW
ncbi:inner membrane protein [Schizosaccharomyces octosporus yFS286]|uniref:Inner membrane protein n=1 Tax=Schizosaccharomyces octosporus (strain yFS286) TaxID=483514 RepID=S9PZB9_SCHOY|nr:inner membrane protein [Schizosaccharomyces octosporus yFS286]EPX74416.1 inner membrane protein [Schizosaccharomyces octosporus yFS286]